MGDVIKAVLSIEENGNHVAAKLLLQRNTMVAFPNSDFQFSAKRFQLKTFSRFDEKSKYSMENFDKHLFLSDFQDENPCFQPALIKVECK